MLGDDSLGSVFAVAPCTHGIGLAGAHNSQRLRLPARSAFMRLLDDLDMTRDQLFRNTELLSAVSCRMQQVRT